MKIDEQILSIPPYISTTWDNIISIQIIKKNTLLITLLDGTKVKAPGLSETELDKVFQSHIKFVENEDAQIEKDAKLKFTLPEAEGNEDLKPSFSAQELLSKLLMAPGKDSLDIPIQLSGDGLQGMGLGMQHNPLQKNSPNLPEELLKKVANIARLLSDDKFSLPQPVDDHCNCFYCQIARAIQPEEDCEDKLELNTPVKDEELKFRLWDVQECGPHTYKVTNPLDAQEEYKVYLKSPMGCTCGKKNCEHIKAVLES